MQHKSKHQYDHQLSLKNHCLLHESLSLAGASVSCKQSACLILGLPFPLLFVSFPGSCCFCHLGFIFHQVLAMLLCCCLVLDVQFLHVISCLLANNAQNRAEPCSSFCSCCCHVYLCILPIACIISALQNTRSGRQGQKTDHCFQACV